MEKEMETMPLVYAWPTFFQNYGSICCFGFPLNKIDEEMEGVEPTA